MSGGRDNNVVRAEPVRRFAIQAAVVLGLFTTLVFVGIFWRTATLLDAGAREQATSYIDLIVNARAWNAHFGGVWVEKAPGVESNPFLRELGVEPDTSTVAGSALTLRNPAAMTNEISRIAEQTSGVHFRLTSLRPVNPADAPDEWERRTLEGFETDRAETSTIERRPSGRVLRAMRPLLVDESCLRCHEKQGYRVGDVRGAISLTPPLTATDRAIRESGLVLLGIFTVVVLVGGAIGYRLVSRLEARVVDSERSLNHLATTDALTGIGNRRAVIQRLEEELARGARAGHVTGVIELDADLFKNVNDTYGHAAGDEVLREIATRMLGALREYDVVGRLGGEEFLVVAPDIGRHTLAELAERLRLTIEERPVTFEQHLIPVTVSVGSTLAGPDDTAESALARVDTALYAAKAAGRNRVETA